MKFRNIITLALAATVGFAVQADAQDKKPTLTARVVRKAKEGGKASKMANLPILSSTKPGVFTYQKDADTTPEMSIEKTFSTFYVLSPPALVEAMRLYAAEDFEPARAALHKVRKQLENWRGVPEGPFLRAYRAELECAVRQLDFAGAAHVVAEFPQDVEKILTVQDKVSANAVKLLYAATKEGGIDPAKIEENVKTIVSKQGKSVTPSQYGWLHFALGAAYQSTIPADQIASNAIAEEHKLNASKAIDAYCTAGISSHGAQMELPVEAMKRAQLLLWSMPGVQNEAKDMGHPTPQKFKKASQNFQDAVSLAYMLINVYGVEAGDNTPIGKAAKLFQNLKAKKK